MQALLVTLAVTGTVVAVGTIVGASLLAWLRGTERPVAIAPAVGLGAIVLWHSTLGLVVPPGSWAAVAVTVVASAILVAVTSRRRAEPFAACLAKWRTLVAATALGLLCAVPFLLVVARSGSTSFVHLGTNHDGYFFTAVPQWLSDHTTLGGSGLVADGSAVDTPLLGSTWDVFWNGRWRVGSDALTSAASRLVGGEADRVWMSMAISYLVVLVAAAQAMARSLGLSAARSLVAAAVVGTAAATLDAVVDQHTPTVLALALLVVLAIELWRGATSDDDGASPFLVALCAGAVAAVYVELLSLALLPLLAVTLVSWRRAGRVDLIWLRTTAVWSVVLAGPAWIRGLSGAATGSAPGGFRSAFAAGDGWFSSLNAFARGSSQPIVSISSVTALTAVAVTVFALVLVGGLVATFRFGDHRVWWASLLVSVALWWFGLGFVDRSGYPQQRLVEWGAPLLLLGALVGWDAISRRPITLAGPRTSPRVAKLTGVGVFALAALVLIGPGLERAARIEERPGRRVDGELAAAADWVAQRDPIGGATLVLTSDYMMNLWTPFVLRDLPATSYLNVYREYFAVDHLGPAAGRRWLLLDREAFERASIPANSVVESNGRFVLVDLHSGGPVELEVPPGHHGRWSATGEVARVVLDGDTVSCSVGGDPVACA